MDPVAVTSPRHPDAAEADVEGIHYYRCPPERSGGSVWLRDAARVKALAARTEQLVKSLGTVRVLHAHSPVLCGLSALRVGRRLGIPVVYEVRSLWEEEFKRQPQARLSRARYLVGRLMETRVCRAADAVVVISQGLRDEFLGRGISQNRLHVIGNGVEPDRFPPQPVRPLPGEASDAPRSPLLLYLGGLRHYEGVHLLLDAFAEIHRFCPEARLAIVGDGNERASIAARVNGSELPVRLLPPVSPDQVPDYYAAADVVVYPRLSDRETERVTPLKPLEALAMGKAIVASDVGGLRELLTEGETARFFHAGSVESLVAVCRELLADSAQRDSLSEKAKEVARSRFNWKTVVSRYSGVYESARARRENR